MASPSKSGEAPVNKVFGAILVLLGFAISVGLVNITKWIYVKYDFQHPLFLTGTHMLTSSLLACGMIFSGAVPNRPILSLRQSVFLVGPFSIAGATSLACSNMAMVMIFPSFHAMLQSSTPFWTVLCAMALSGKRYNLAAYLALIPVCGGSAICTRGERSEFRMLGVFLSLASAALRGLKSVLQGILLRGQDLRLDSISLLYYSSPLNIALFLGASAWSEGLAPWTDYARLPMAGRAWVWTAAAAAAVFNLVGFYTIGYLGPVVSNVAGNLKSPVVILACHLIFDNPASFQQMVGFSVVASGVIAYDRLGKEVPVPAPKQVIAAEERGFCAARGGGKDTDGSRGRRPYLDVGDSEEEGTEGDLEPGEGHGRSGGAAARTSTALGKGPAPAAGNGVGNGVRPHLIGAPQAQGAQFLAGVLAALSPGRVW